MRFSPLARAFALLLLFPALGGGSCDTMARQHPVSLETEVFEFHQLIKNKKFSDASLYVREDLRDQFLNQWRRGETLLDIQEVEVTRVQKSPDAEFAQVDARMSFVMAGSLTVKQHKLFELWKGVGKTWEIDAEVRPPPDLTPVATPAPAADPAKPAPAQGGDTNFGGGTY